MSSLMGSGVHFDPLAGILVKMSDQIRADIRAVADTHQPRYWLYRRKDTHGTHMSPQYVRNLQKGVIHVGLDNSEPTSD